MLYEKKTNIKYKLIREQFVFFLCAILHFILLHLRKLITVLERQISKAYYHTQVIIYSLYAAIYKQLWENIHPPQKFTQTWKRKLSWHTEIKLITILSNITWNLIYVACVFYFKIHSGIIIMINISISNLNISWEEQRKISLLCTDKFMTNVHKKQY